MQPLQKLQQSVASAMAGLSEEQMYRHPPGKWCAAEVLEHLYLTYAGTLKGLERALAAGIPNATPPAFRQRVAKFVVLGLGYVPSGRESPAAARPRGLPSEKVLSEILPKIAEMDELLSRCEVKLGHGPIMNHPFLGPFTAQDWKRFHLVHGEHHLKQVWRLRKTRIGSPVSR
jgi:hypothetical protein